MSMMFLLATNCLLVEKGVRKEKCVVFLFFSFSPPPRFVCPDVWISSVLRHDPEAHHTREAFKGTAGSRLSACS